MPNFPNPEFIASIENDGNILPEARRELLDWSAHMRSGIIFFEENGSTRYGARSVYNLFLSQCYNCDKLSLWRGERLLYPELRQGVLPNADLPDDIKQDFDEARSIVSLSPRGAAALLRLCIQKLCIQLGEKGRSIDEDIANMVKKGLDPRTTKALDIVRVVGNEAVHPGQMNLKDDQTTAIKLFGLVNAICDQMISHPKSLDELYGQIPPAKRDGIEKRDAKKD